MGLRSFFRRRRNRYVGAAAAVILVIGAGAGLYVGKDDHVPYSAGARVMMQFLASRDMGRIPSRSGWCTAVRSAEHCWLLQESSGDAIDTGVAGTLWPLVPEGTPRRGIVGSIPIQSAGIVEVTSEKGTHFDGASLTILQKATNAPILPVAINLVSVTAVFGSWPSGDTEIFMQRSIAPSYGIEFFIDGPTSVIKVIGKGTIQKKVVAGLSSVEDGAPHCVTGVFDGRTSDAARIFLDGADDTSAIKDLSGSGSWEGDGQPTVGGWYDGQWPMRGGIYRVRLDYAALTLPQHQQLCGSLWQPPSKAINTRTKVAAADTSWTQTGGVRCYASSATTALCAPGGSPTYAWTAALAGIGWPIEPDRTNRVLQSVDLSDAAWGGSATQTAVAAPDGSLTAWQAAYTDVATTTQAVTGYGVTATLFPRLWVKCSSGTFKINTTVGTGQWDINCTTIAGAWTDIHSGATAVTVNTAMASDGAGAFTLALASDGSGATVDVWMPTVTEANGISVIPTAGAAVATGAIAWEIDNSSGAYYFTARGKVTMIGDWTLLLSTGFGFLDGAAFVSVYNNAKWRMWDASASVAWGCTLSPDLSGLDTLIIRWDSAAIVSDDVDYAECLLNDVKQAWTGDPPLSSWVPRLTDVVRLSSASHAQTFVLQEFKVENRP